MRFLDKEMHYLVLRLMKKLFFFSNCADKFSIRTDCLLVFCLLFLPIVKWTSWAPLKAKDVSWKAYFRFVFFFTQTVKPISSFRLIEVEKQGMEKLHCVKSDWLSLSTLTSKLNINIFIRTKPKCHQRRTQGMKVININHMVYWQCCSYENQTTWLKRKKGLENLKNTLVEKVVSYDKL